MKTILVMEDDATIRNLLCLVMSKTLTDCTVIDAADGLEGLAVLKCRPVDLIVTDIRMPRLDGFGVMEQARLLYPEIPVYVMSAHCDPAMRAQLLRLGMSHYFEKPFSFETMAELAALDLGLCRPDLQLLSGEVCRTA